MFNAYSVLFLCKDGNVQSWTGDSTTYNGYNAHEIVGKHYKTFYTKNDIEDLVPENLLAQAIDNVSAAYVGTQLRKDGSSFEGNMLITTRYDHQNTAEGFSIATFDIARQLAQSEFNHTNLEALINNTDDLVWSIDVNNNLITSNMAFDNAIKKLTGNVIKKGKSADNLGFTTEKLETYRQYYKRAFEGEKFTEIDYTPPPYERWSVVSFHPIIQDNAITGTACIAHDITESKRAEIKLHESEYKFRTLIESNADGILLFSADIKPFYASPSVVQMLGYSQEEIPHLDLFSLIHPADIAPLQKKFETIFAQPGVPIPGHTSKMRHKDGSWRWIAATVTNMLHDPAINGIVDNIRDVTEQVISEHEIRNANRLYAVISQINQTIVHVKDEQTLFDRACEIAIEQGNFKAAWIGIIDSQNATINLVASSGADVSDIYQYEKETYGQQGGMWEVLKTSPHYICNNIEESDKLPSCKLIASSNGIRAGMVLPVRKAGKVIGIFNFYADEIDFFKDQEIGLLMEVTGDISFAIDVFEKDKNRKEAENKLKHNTFRLEQAQHIAHFGSWEFDFSAQAVIFSEELCRIYGLDISDNVQTPDFVRSLIHPDDMAEVREILDKNNATYSSSNFYHRILRPDGVIRHIHSLTHFEFDISGTPIGMYGTAHDITEQTFNVIKLNKQNEQLRKIADIQSHKVRGPLATILGLTLLLNDAEVQSDTREVLDGIIDTSHKLDKVIREVVNTTYGDEEMAS